MIYIYICMYIYILNEQAFYSMWQYFSSLTAGSVEEVRAHLKHTKESMRQLISLDTLPDMTCDEHELRELADLQTIPFEEEERLIWAIAPEEDRE